MIFNLFWSVFIFVFIFLVENVQLGSLIDEALKVHVVYSMNYYHHIVMW